MKRLLVTVFLVVSVVAVGQQQSSVDAALNGSLDDQVYRNDYFGFTFRLRPGWEVVPEQVRNGFVSDLHAPSPEADNRALLMLFRPTHGAIIPDVIVVASARYPRTSRTSVNEALAKLRRDRHSERDIDFLRDPYVVKLGNMSFAREDLKVRGKEQYMVNMILVLHSHVLSFQIHTGSKQRIDEIAKTVVEAVSFSETLPPEAHEQD